MKSFSFTIQDPLGIHARPAGQLVKEASKYESAITIARGDKEADLKKVFRLMSLGVKTGETVTLVIEGPDEAEAARNLEAYIKTIL